MTLKTYGDELLRKTCRKQIRIFMALAIFGLVVLSVAGPAKAEGTPTSVVVFTDKSVYNPFNIDLGQKGGTPFYKSDLSADFSIYVYALVLNEKGLILKGREGLLSGTLVDIRENRHTDVNNHTGAIITNPGVVGSKPLVFKDDGSINGDMAGDGIYVALVDMPEDTGTKLAAPTDELLINITVTDPVAGSAFTDVLIAGFNCMSSQSKTDYASAFSPHVSSSAVGTGYSDDCVVCHRGYEHFFENVSGVIDNKYLDAHFKNATARSKVPNPLHSSVRASKDWDLHFRWNLSDYNGNYPANTRTLEDVAPGSKYCYFCHTYNYTSTGVLKYGDQRNDPTRIPYCNNNNCHTSTKIGGNAVPAWSPPSAAMNISNPSMSSPNYNVSLAVKHAHDSTGRDTVPCASCHTTVHGLQIPNSTSADYTDLTFRCLSCHQLFNKHNGSVPCIKCHNNDVHNIRFLQQDLTYNWSMQNVVTCDNCHTNKTFANSLGLNPPQVPYTNHSEDHDAGQKWGDYWTSRNQQDAVGGSTLIKSSTFNVSSESVSYGSTAGSPAPLLAAQSVDGNYETLIEGIRAVPPTDVNTSAQSNNSKFGTISNWSNIQNASDSGAYATFTEVSSGSWTNASYFGSVLSNSGGVANASYAEAYDGWVADLNGANNLVSLGSWRGLNGAGSITGIRIVVRAKTTGNDNLKLSYDVNGQQGTTTTTFTITTTLANYSINITNDRTWTWEDLANIDANATQIQVSAADNVQVDSVLLQVSYTALNAMDITATMSVPEADNYFLEMRYYTSGDTFNVYAYNGTTWNNKGALTQTGTFALFNASLTAEEYVGGNPQIRFRDRQTSSTAGNLYIDYMRIHGWTANTSHQEIMLYHNLTGIPLYPAKETAEYTVIAKGYSNSGENLDIYIYAYDSGMYELVKDKAFSATDKWVNWTIPYEAISPTGEAHIMFRDSNRTRYDDVANSFSLDYVGIRANSYKFLPCYYCHALLANHKPRAIGNIERVQSGPGGQNKKNSTDFTGYWCANCHYNGSAPNGSYRYNGSAWNPVPPRIEINNAQNNPGSWFDHSSTLVTNFTDAKCKECHGNPKTNTTKDFPHTVEVGSGGGPDCTACHNIGGSAGTGREVNFSAMNDSLAIHKYLNSGASSPSGYPSQNFKCWACHGNGSEPGGGHPNSQSEGYYKLPYRCDDCHVNTSIPYGAPQVLQHYWNGTSINTSAATSCYDCHNKSEMMLGKVDPDGAAGIYGGANGGNNSTSHYGRKRTDYPPQNTNDYCYMCHSNNSAPAVYPYSNNNNSMISNHSLSYNISNPPCRDCHGAGKIHNITLYKPSFAKSDSIYCLSCHGNNGTGGTNYTGAVTGYKEKHNNSVCTECHLNASLNIHPVQYLKQDGTWSTSKTNAVNCTSCHQTTMVIGGRTATLTAAPVNHSTNPYSGAMWNGSQPAYWSNKSQQSGCDYCHGKSAIHNLSGLGNITRVKGSNAVRQALDTGRWCANCHYEGAPEYAGSSFFPEPPEILNLSGKVPAKASDNTGFYNHSQDIASGFNDSKCRGCHNNKLAADATSLNFTHNLAPGGGGPNCTSCHFIGAGVQNINITALNDTNYIHRDLNKAASSTDSGYNSSKSCWACHGDGSQPSGHPVRYTAPYNCTDCHINASSPFGAMQVSQHYWNGTSIKTPAANNCYACHNVTGLIISAYDPDGASTNVYGGANGGNYSVSHYGRKRNDMAAMDNGTYCNYCHNNLSSVFPFINNTNKTVSNHSANYAATNPGCQGCHSSGRLHNDTLYKPAFNLSNNAYCLSCHGNNGSGGANYTGAITGPKEEHNGSLCNECHLNSTKSVHQVRYLRQNGTWGTTNGSAANCTSCHQGGGMGGFAAAPLVQTPLWHSNNTYSGALWNGTQPRFWDNKSQQSSCDYCHGKSAIHNAQGLGRSYPVQGTNLKNQSLGGSFWCANCHYKGAAPSGNYNYKGDTLSPVPPEIFNLTGLVPANSSDGTPFQNHTTNIGGDWSDTRCRNCHGKDLPSDTTSAVFVHRLNQSAPETGGPDCLKCHASTASFVESEGTPMDMRINKTAFTNYSVHRDMNSNASSSVALSDNRSKACWACHGDGAQPIKHHMNYTSPKSCESCHVSGDYGASLVYRHYPGSVFLGTLVYDNAAPGRTCASCHNNSIVRNVNISYGADSEAKIRNASASHYSVNRSTGISMGLAATGALPNTTYTNGCRECHNINGAPYGTHGIDYGNARAVPSGHNDMGSTPLDCELACHNSQPVAASLHDSAVGVYMGTGNCYSLGCHTPPPPCSDDECRR